MSTRLGDRLDAARQRGFVGRRRELAAFHDLLDPGSATQILLVHGAGGVGKTALLHRYAWQAGQAGRPIAWLDGHDPDSRDPELLADRPGLVLLVDAVEQVPGLARRLRQELIPRLPGDAAVVIAGRDRPDPVWRADPGWRELVRILPLGNLGHEDGLALLAARGVPEEERAAALEFTRGHPLALALVADVSAQRRFSAVSAQEVLGELLRGFVETVPSSLHRQALEACALVLATTEPLLAALLGLDDASELFAWLRGLSIVEYGSRGLFPHDLARDALAAELGWRDPDGCAEIRRRAAAYYRRSFFAAGPPVLLDYVYLHRATSVLGPFVTGYPQTSGLSADRPTGAELGTVVSWVRKHEGEESARLCERWLARQPPTVIRDADGTAVGFYLLIDVAADPEDPATRDLAPGHTRMVRFWMDGRHYQEPSPVQLFITTHLFRSYLTEDVPGRTLLTFAEAEPWEQGCAHVGFHRAPEADFTVGEQTFAVFEHDWRAVPPEVWVTRLAERDALIEPVTVPRRALSEEEFGQAVRDALRAYGRADGLRDSPLLGMLTLPEGDPATGLRAVFEEVAAQLAASPRDLKVYRALHHTFLRPARTQADAADLLGLPTTTYRRHLAAAEARFTELLWRRAR
ncbi:P-loop NTPase [Acrocarpospora catenulata]|uniref:P-loop NTPase n=1 Tax=Acrocarpospora catenulata TaxID=2836182 RepID=UPI001BD9376D|nr:ATP-binding protein [Acrocarpospora catenulata]